MPHLDDPRDTHDVDVIDVDGEIVRLNGGSWADIGTKNERYLPMVLEAAAALPSVVVFNSYMPLERGLVDHVIDGHRPPMDVAADVADLVTAAPAHPRSPAGSSSEFGSARSCPMSVQGAAVKNS